MKRYRISFKVGEDEVIEAATFIKPNDCYVFLNEHKQVIARFLSTNVAGITLEPVKVEVQP